MWQKRKGVEHGPAAIREAGLMKRLSNLGKWGNLRFRGGRWQAGSESSLSHPGTSQCQLCTASRSVSRLPLNSLCSLRSIRVFRPSPVAKKRVFGRQGGRERQGLGQAVGDCRVALRIRAPTLNCSQPLPLKFHLYWPNHEVLMAHQSSQFPPSGRSFLP